MNTPAAPAQKTAPSMRQRRRERTHAAIHSAALSLVMEQGLKRTTTGQIADRAGVSPRTLFNYFAGKEEAVLGLRTPVITDEILQGDQARADLYIFERIVHLLIDILVRSVDGPTYPQIKELLGTYPELRFRMRTHQLTCETVLADFLRSVDWQIFSQRGRRGPIVYRTETELKPLAEEKVQATICITSALLRYIDLTHGIPSGSERDAAISDAVSTFRYLLREDKNNDLPLPAAPIPNQ